MIENIEYILFNHKSSVSKYKSTMTQNLYFIFKMNTELSTKEKKEVFEHDSLNINVKKETLCIYSRTSIKIYRNNQRYFDQK